MIDPTALPVLLKAMDFLFDQGSKIMEERRERRKKTGETVVDEKSDAPSPAPSTPTEAEPGKIEPAKAGPVKIVSREDALKEHIDEFLWKEMEFQVKHQLVVIEDFTKNYHLAQKQFSQWGDALVPPIVMHNMETAEKNLTAAIKDLQDLLSKIYGRPFDVIEKEALESKGSSEK